MARHRSRPSRFGTLLAMLALMGLLARPALACGMAMEATVATDAGLDPHAGHGARAAAPESTQANPDGAGDAPAPAIPCDHLVGCAAMAISPAAVISVAAHLAHAALPSAPDSHVDAPARALDPPPPKA